MIIFCEKITPRARYMADFIGGYFTGHPAKMTSDRGEFAASDSARINYSRENISVRCLRISPHSLLFEQGIQEQVTDCFVHNGYPAFFKTDGDWPFDILSAIFYLLSRYEEYLPHQKDIYGRYAHENSLAFREGFLDKPLVNIWLNQFGEELRKLFPAGNFIQQRFQFIPTYDIDEAYCYKYKSWWRSAGAALRDLLKGKWKAFAQRRRVLNNKEQDPFDSYDQLHNLHRPYHCKPVYFFLMAAQTGRYDKNILPDETAMQRLIKEHAAKYTIGIHPSWQSGDNAALLQSEKDMLEKTAGIKVTASRQHFIRLSLPSTYRELLKAGVKEDYSMGYGSINGFRASVASSFYWYDLEKEEQTHLRLFPFCYMEANSYYEQKQTPPQALNEMQHFYREVSAVNGWLITIWHNTFVGTAQRFEGWKDAWFDFFHRVMKDEQAKTKH